MSSSTQGPSLEVPTPIGATKAAAGERRGEAGQEEGSGWVGSVWEGMDPVPKAYARSYPSSGILHTLFLSNLCWHYGLRGLHRGKGIVICFPCWSLQICPSPTPLVSACLVLWFFWGGEDRALKAYNVNPITLASMFSFILYSVMQSVPELFIFKSAVNFRII